ncbi:MAG: hypothetical protein IKK33_10975 [Lachnospiraceae bacterium]|nr:hypothetical protein [Lachnospiraceae bacterium]
MDVTPKKLSTKKIAAIALMALAFLMLNMSWIKLDSDGLDAVDEMRDNWERSVERIYKRIGFDIEYDNLADALAEWGLPQNDIEAIVRPNECVDKMLDELEKGSYSVWTVVYLSSLMGHMKELYTDDVPHLSDSDADDSSSMLIIVFSIIIVVVFALTGLLMIIAILLHVKDKRALGLPATILSILLAVIFAFLGVVMKTEFEYCRITAAPILTAVFALASCIVWAGARKQIAK